MSITPIGCLVAMLVGLLITWYLFPTRFINAQISDFSDDEAQDIVIMAAADFAEHGDEERARALLAELEVPNQAQYVSLVAERMIRTNRGGVDQDIDNVVRLADALGVSTISMIVYVSSPTSTPTITSVPTDAPTITPTPTNTLVVQAVAAPEQIIEEAAVEEVPLIELFPIDTPVPEAPAAATPVPIPTDTPEPEATPVPEFDYIITKQRMLTKEENGGCVGMHNIFVDVVDSNGAPIKDVELGDVWGNPGPSTGHKGDDEPGRAVYDLYKNGFKIFVKNDPTAGRSVTSQVTELLSSNDWEIGIPQLIESGYCPDEGTCRVLWNSGVFGEGNNSLCWGHYSWEVTFQRTW
ncbi:MAG TPA: hypothetical protein VGD99_25410 [Anaerolineae bacterium]